MRFILAARPVWKGQLRLSLVAIAVEMYSATVTGARVSFRQIHKPSGKPVNYEKVSALPGPAPPAPKRQFCFAEQTTI